MHRFLDKGLDELAARSHDGLPLRVAVSFAIGGLATTMVAWKTCLAWIVVQVACEAVSWFTSRQQYLGLKVGLGARLAHLATFALGCVIWMVLGGLFWSSGSAEGAICGAAVWLSVIFFTQTNAYQSPVGFVVGGALPGLGMLVWVATAPNPLHLAMLPLLGVFVLCLGFACDGVFRTLAARQTFEEAQARLAASEAQYRVLADNITDVIALNELDGRRVYMSPSMAKIMGFTPDELLATTNYTFLHPDDATWLPGKIAAMVARGGEMTEQYRVLHKDGHPIWVETNFGLIPPTEPDGKAQLISVSRNIDARKAMETELVDARRRAEAAAAAKSDFLANMTHELRTPLNAIIGFAGVVKGSPRLSGEDARHVGLIHDASETLLDLVNGVLDFSKLDAGAAELEAKPFDPADPARAVVGLLAEQAADRGLTLEVRTEGEIAPLVGDAQRLRQVLLNFLSNALKFTPTGGITVIVRQSASEAARNGAAQGRLRVEVSDTGIGIAPDQIAHLFGRFTQADASVSREYGGTGLGLAICQRTIELMGGTIGADSSPGQGSTFWFELVLPRAKALVEEAKPRGVQGPERPLRLLVVEDVAVNRELILALLGPFEIEIETAENGARGVEAFGAGAYDLVLMDVQMPVMDGLTATRAIRALPGPAAQSTPIIAMTANVLPDQVETCLAAGMDDHLGKPINPAALLGILARWSNGRDAVDLAKAG